MKQKIIHIRVEEKEEAAYINEQKKKNYKNLSAFLREVLRNNYKKVKEQLF